MKRQIQRALALFIIAWLSTAPRLTLASSSDPTRLEEIKSWKPLGKRWAGGLNKEGELLAVYDLSYPTFQNRISLGVLNTVNASYDTLIQLFLRARGSANSIRTEGVAPSEDYEKATAAIEALQELKKETEKTKLLQTGSLLPDYWWKTIPWKRSLRSIALDDHAPTHFFLSDINYQAIVKNPKEFQQLLDRLGGAFFDQIEFNQNNEGSFEVFWSPHNKAFAQEVAKVPPPLKIADLKCPTCGISEQSLQSEFSSLFQKLVGQIPLPVLAGLIQMSVGQWIEYQTQLWRTHQAMALEVLQSADDSSSFSPFSAIPLAEREALASSLMYSLSTPFNAWFWFFKTPAADWEGLKKLENACALDSENYLKLHAQKLTSLNPRFATGEDSKQNKRIYLLAASRYWNILSPWIALDYAAPSRIRNERIKIESGFLLVKFLEVFLQIPYLPHVISSAYNLLIEQPMHTVEAWDARLEAHLEVRTSVGESWGSELEILRKQRVNPMELSLEVEEKLISERIQEFVIKE